MVVSGGVKSPECGRCQRGEAFGVSRPIKDQERVEDGMLVNCHEDG